MERMHNGPYPAVTGKLRPDQIATRKTWAGVADENTKLASLHSIHVVQKNWTTVTYVNPLDPGDGMDSNWYDPPAAPGSLPKAVISR